MNINLNLSPEIVERAITALERIAHAVELIAGPNPPEVTFEPYRPLDWMESSNAQSRAIEEEERREAQGFGPAYERQIEAAAIDILKRAGVPAPTDRDDRRSDQGE